MDIFLHSTLLIAIGEMGDKTQLLTMMLVARYLRLTPIALGILLATIVNHALAVLLGQYIGSLADILWVQWALALSFVALGLWMLHPDNVDNLTVDCKHGAFFTAFTMFFIAEIGDKTEIATVSLAAEYQRFMPVLLGTTAGMMLANIPALLLGRAFLARINVTWMHRIAAVLFIGFGVSQMVPLLA